MSHPEQRTINELVVRYELEPTLRDVFVEGAEDKYILEGILAEHDMEAFSVFEISSINVPSEPGQETNSRTRLIALADELACRLRGRHLHVACVIDSDFDHLTNQQSSNTLLLRTDYANMEMYFFSWAVFEKLNARCLRARHITKQMIDRFVVPTLRTLFVIRYVNSHPKWRLTYFSFQRLLRSEAGRFLFDAEEYLRRYLNRNGRLREIEDFLTERGSVAVPPETDPRCFMHGHDFLELLLWLLNELLGRKVYTKLEAVLDMLKACADYRALADEPMFVSLRERLR